VRTQIIFLTMSVCNRKHSLYPYKKEGLSRTCSSQDVSAAVASDAWTSGRDLNSDTVESPSFMMSFSIGKLSVLILLLATILDFCACQVHRLEDAASYDVLSAEVIRPAFHYQTAASSNVKQRSSLGSAAIASVTTALSPILPFAGGLDLRREDYWTTPGTWFERVQSVATQVQDAFSGTSEGTTETSATKVARGGGNVIGSGKKGSFVSTLSAPKPFVSLESIADLTLQDVTDTFRYALEYNKPGFNEQRFVNSLLPRVKKVVSAMSEAVSKSRGKEAKASCYLDESTGSVDALAFSAAMRVFAEWRILRQVPEGYKGYAVGMSLGHKDVVQNVAKIEHTVHSWLDSVSDGALSSSNPCSKDDSELRSPTLRQLMQYEIDFDINPESRLPRLNDKTASMGLLWVRRQLQYQTHIFGNVLKIPNKFPSTPAAVTAAYEQVYDKIHGWAVQKIFNYSFQSAPDSEVIYRHMNPHRLKELTAKAQKMNMSGSPNEMGSSEKTDDNPIGAFFNHIGGEWDKFASSVVQIFDQNRLAAEMTRGVGAHSIGALSDEAENFITREMVNDAHQNIAVHIGVAQPLLDDLAQLFDELNMDDPTRV
jgi:hypothetical protein